MKTVHDPFTDDMFLVPQPEHPAPGSANFAFEIANIVSQMLKETHMDRWEIAAQMSRLSGDDVSKNMLDAWASPGRPDHNIPFYRAVLLEEVLGSHTLTNWMVAKRGGRVAYGKDALNARLGKLTVKKKQVDQQIRELQKMMGETE